jgi:selenocysteine lyase/cysteine desulfurase
MAWAEIERSRCSGGSCFFASDDGAGNYEDVLNPTPATIESDLRRWRADSPAAEAGRIHLNNAGASLMPRPVLAAITSHLELESKLGGYEASDAAAIDIGQTYQRVAALIGTQAQNIALVENATVAFAQALSAFDFTTGDVLLTTRNDYISNQLMYRALAQRRGLNVIRADDLPEGGVDPESIRRHIERQRPKLVAVTWVPTNSGLVQPVEAIGEICSELDVPYLVDACQAVGQLCVDVGRVRCDFLSATGRKFLRGPRGTGFLYVSPRMLEQDRYPLLVDMRGARWLEADSFELAATARRFENWEFAYALLLGLGEAARYAQDVGLGTIQQRVLELAAYTRQRLAGLPGVRVLDRGPYLCGIVTAEIGTYDARTVVQRLREEAINTGATLREFAVLDMDDKRAASALRISPHYYNTKRELDTLISALEEFVTA